MRTNIRTICTLIEFCFTNGEWRTTRLAGLRSQELAVTIDASPIAVDKRHGIAADRAIRRRSLGNEWKKIWKLVIVFVHHFLAFPLFDLELKGLFCALPTRNSDERQLSVENCRRHGSD